MWLSLPSVAAAACSDEAWSAHIEAAERAFVAMDEGAFESATTAAVAEVRDLCEPLPAERAAAFHRMRALSAFLDGDRPGQVQHLSAAAAAWPEIAIPTAMAPRTHPLVKDLELVRGLPTPPDAPLPPARGGAYRVDGTPSTRVPTTRPYLFQYVLGDRAIQSALLDAGLLPQQTPSKQRSPEAALWIAGAGMSAVAVATYAAGTASHGTFFDASTADADLERLRTRTNALAVASASTGAIGIGLLGTAVVVHFR